MAARPGRSGLGAGAGPAVASCVVTPARSGPRSRVVEPAAVVRGALVAVAVCLPLALLGAALDDGGSGAVGALLFLGVLAGLAVGGAVAARAARRAPFTNGGLAALLAFVAIQGSALGVTAARGGDLPSIPSLVFNGLLAYGCGVAGGAVTARGGRAEAGA